MANKELDDKINNLSMMEQNSNYLASQRQSFQNQMLEIDSALEELETSSDSYVIIGNIMVNKEKSEIKKQLESKKEIVNVRITSIEKQEAQIKEKSEKLRQEVMKGLNTEKGDKNGKS